MIIIIIIILIIIIIIIAFYLKVPFKALKDTLQGTYCQTHWQLSQGIGYIFNAGTVLGDFVYVIDSWVAHVLTLAVNVVVN